MQFKFKPCLLTLTVIVLVMMLSNPTQAQTNIYYVSVKGDDNNPGSELQPFRTINRGVRVLQPGDTLLVKAGTYKEALNNSIPSGVSWERPVTLQAFPGDKVTIKPIRKQKAERVINFRSNHYIVIDGFILDGTYVLYETVKFSGNVDSAIESPHHIRLINNVIRNAGAAQSSKGEYRAFSSGVLATGNANYIEYINNEIYNNGVTDFDHGIYQISSYALIDGNTIHNNKGTGIKIGWGQNAVDNVVRNNLIYNNNVARGANGKKKQGRGIGVYAGSGTLVYNNVIRGAHHSGIDVTYGGNNTLIFNNTIYNTSGYGIAVGFGEPTAQSANNTIVRNNIVVQRSSLAAIINMRGTNTVIENNLTFGKNSDVIQGEGGGNAIIANNLIGVDPNFVSISQFDFALRSGSPAIDTGTILYEVARDFSGRVRPQGNGLDLGAFEFEQPLLPQSARLQSSVLPVPIEAAIRVEMRPSSQTDGVMGVSINLYNLTDIYGIQAQCVTDPTVMVGTELSYGSDTIFNDDNSLFIDQAYTADGQWVVGVSRLQPAEAFSGNGTAFVLNYQVQTPVSRPVDCTVMAVDMNGRPIPVPVTSIEFNADGTIIN